jgi:hypothetical protein
MANTPLTLAAMKLLRENICSQPQNPKQKLQPLIRTEWTLSNELRDRVESNTHMRNLYVIPKNEILTKAQA